MHYDLTGSEHLNFDVMIIVLSTPFAIVVAVISVSEVLLQNSGVDDETIFYCISDLLMVQQKV